MWVSDPPAHKYITVRGKCSMYIHPRIEDSGTLGRVHTVGQGLAGLMYEKITHPAPRRVTRLGTAVINRSDTPQRRGHAAMRGIFTLVAAPGTCSPHVRPRRKPPHHLPRTAGPVSLLLVPLCPSYVCMYRLRETSAIGRSNLCALLRRFTGR